MGICSLQDGISQQLSICAMLPAKLLCCQNIAVENDLDRPVGPDVGHIEQAVKLCPGEDGVEFIRPAAYDQRLPVVGLLKKVLGADRRQHVSKGDRLTAHLPCAPPERTPPAGPHRTRGFSTDTFA